LVNWWICELVDFLELANFVNGEFVTTHQFTISPIHQFANIAMIISPATIVTPTAPVEFRRMTPNDIEAGLRLCRTARWDQVARDWERFLAPPSTATVAVRKGGVVGTAAVIRYGTRFGWIGMVLVDPGAQGQGLGPSLLTHSLEALRDLSAIRLDATPAGYPLYLKQAFVEESRLKRMESPAPICPAVPAHATIQQMTRADLAEAAAMDLDVFGASRKELLEWMYEGSPDDALVARRGDELVGYLFGRHGFEFDHLGPIVAREPGIAMQLTASCLGQHRSRPFIIDAACHDDEWMRFLEESGFREQRPFIRMHRGGDLPFGRPREQFAVLGPEFG
jgi:GNAT superfamily N-acetyltransferase